MKNNLQKIFYPYYKTLTQMNNMRKYHDFDEEVKYLVRSKTDDNIKKSFEQEVDRATNFFIDHYIKGDSIKTCDVKTRSSYGTIITDIVMINLYQLMNK